MYRLCSYNYWQAVGGAAVARIREKVPKIMQTHCMIHREMLVAKHLGRFLSEILSLRVKIVNFIKVRPLQSRTFSKLCDEQGSEQSSLLLIQKFDGCRKEKERVFELQEELSIFLQEHNANLASLVQFRLYSGFCTPFGVSRVVCGSHYHLLAPWATRLLSQ